MMFASPLSQQSRSCRRPSSCWIAVLGVVALSAFAMPLRASFNYPDFSSVAGLTLNGDAIQSGIVLRVTPDAEGQAGSAWYTTAKQHLADGFDTTFTFRMSGGMSGDGMAFVIQDEATTALGGTGSGLGYDGITRSIAIEFDTFGFYPESDNHISVQTRGASNNSPDDQFSLVQVNMQTNLNDGNLHQVRIRYRPGVLLVFFDGSDAPTIDLAINLQNINGDNILDGSGDAWVGFTAGTGLATENHDVESWSFDVTSSPLPTGPCCTPSGCIIATQHDCHTLLGGFFAGPEGGDCGQTQCAGACCTGEFCTSDTSLSDCIANGGTFRGVDVQCDFPDYPTCDGACCDPAGICYITNEFDCQQNGGTFHGPGTSCAPFPCSLPTTGACCVANECLTITESDCQMQSGTWYGVGTSCFDISCFDPPPAFGACCQPGGFCVDGVAEIACAHFNGVYQGDGSLCANSNCTPPCDCQRATFIGGGAFMSDSTIGAPACAGITCGEAIAESPAKTYLLIPSTGGFAVIDNCNNANFHSMISIHSGCPFTVENMLACNNAGCGMGASLSLCVRAGQPYYIRVGGLNGESGNYDLAAFVIPAQVSEGPFQNPGNGHWYYTTVFGPWTAAEQIAQSKGGHLATINDAAENEWVRSTFAQFTPVMIGINDAAAEGTFVWASGQPVTYTNWDAVQPDDAGGGEDYGVMQTNGTWIDVPDCSGVNNGEAVIEVDTLTLPGIMAGPIRSPVTCHDYYLTQPGTWIETELKAQSLGGHLASINTPAENEWIRTTFANFGGNPQAVWIGLSDHSTEGVFTWVDGSPVGYTNWNPGEPNDLGNEDYVAMNDSVTGGWNDAHSGEPHSGVIEIPTPHCPCQCPLGDMNCNEAVTTADVPLFVQALLKSGSFGGCNVNIADMNGDMLINGRDVQLFVAAIVGP